MLLSSYRTIKEDKLYGFDGQCLSLFSIIDNNISVAILRDTKELSNINNLEICYKKLSYPYLNYTDKYITINNGKTIYLIDCSDFDIIAKFPNDQYSISFFNRLFLNNKGLYRLIYENQCFDIEQVLKGDFDIVCYYDQSSIILRNKVNNLYYHYTRIIRYPDIDKTLINVYDFSLIKDINIIFLLGSNNVIYANSKTYTFLLK